MLEIYLRETSKYAILQDLCLQYIHRATQIEFKKSFKFKAINKLCISLFYVSSLQKNNQYLTFAKLASLPRPVLYCLKNPSSVITSSNIF